MLVDILSVLTVLAQVTMLILLLILIGSWITKKQTSGLNAWMDRYGLAFIFIVALIATCGSLYLSEILQWTPCKLCWFQRIFMYPQVPLLLVALWKKDKKMAPYIIILCFLGAIFSIYHYTEQIMATFFPPEIPEPCDLTGVSCSQTYTFRFGYITIPMMALSAFLLNFVSAIFLARSQKKK